MADITLPSGLIVKIRDSGPTYGEIVRCTSLGLDKGTEAFTYARFKVMVPKLKRKQIKALSVVDGAALALAVLKVWEGHLEHPNGN
jgi:hypothetical protein